MSISLVQYASNDASSKTSLTVEFSDSQTASNFNVLGVFIEGIDVSSVTDTTGNTYTLAVSDLPGSDYYCYLYFAPNIKSGSNTITITSASSASMWGIAAEFTGVAAGAVVDGSGSNTGSNSNPGSCSLNVTAIGELVVGFSGGSDAIGEAGTGYTLVTTIGNQGMIYQIASATGTNEPEFHYGADANWTVIGASFTLTSPASTGIPYTFPGVMIPH